MKLIIKNMEDIIPYQNNPRKNEKAIKAVCESIKQCGYVTPIILDENGVILAGHTRYKALKKLGRKNVECIVREGLTEEQKKKYRLLDNKTGEFSEWDFDALVSELQEIDFDGFNFDWGVTSFTDEELSSLIDENSETGKKKGWKITIKGENKEQYKQVCSILDDNGLEYSAEL